MILRSLLACGIVGLAFVAGQFALRGPWWRRALRVTADRGIVALALGVALLTPLFVVLAEFGGFRIALLGGIGWLVLAAYIVAQRVARGSVRVRNADLVIALAALVFLAVAVGGRDEPWGQGRDQQVYAEFAALLADTGGATRTTRPVDAADAALMQAVAVDPAVDRYTGVRREVVGDSIVSRAWLPLGWPVWLAVAYAAGGVTALHAANAAVVLLGAWLLHPILRCLVGEILATAAVLALLALPSSLWVAGIALSEPLAMVMLLTAIALFGRGYRRDGCVAAIVIAAILVRLDMLLLVPVLILVRIAHSALRPAAGNPGAGARFTLLLLLAAAVSLAWYAAFDRRYLVDAAGLLVPVGLATSLVAGAVLVRDTRLIRVRMLGSSRVALLASVGVVALAAYCLWVRPFAPPFATIHNGTGLDGTRDYREETLRNLATYASWPLLLLAVAGAAMGTLRLPRPSVALAERALTAAGLAYGALYVYAPLVSPDQPWAIRRFVPVVIPMVVVFAVFAVRGMARRPVYRVAASVAIVAAATSASVVAGAPLTTLRENRGAAALIDAVDRDMPNGLVLASLPVGNLGSVLAIARGRRVVVVDLDRAEHRTAVARWIEARSVTDDAGWLLVGDDSPPAGAHTHPVAKWQYERAFLARTVKPPARVVRTETVRASLLRVDGLDAGLAYAGFGGTRAWRIADRGFWPAEATPFGTLRMTDGTASLEVPAMMLADATALEFTWFSWAPHGERTHVAVGFDGRAAWHAGVAPGVSTVTLPFRPSAGDRIVRIDVRSDTFDPRGLAPGDFRDRVGVGVIRIRALR